MPGIFTKNIAEKSLLTPEKKIRYLKKSGSTANSLLTSSLPNPYNIYTYLRNENLVNLWRQRHEKLSPVARQRQVDGSAIGARETGTRK